MASVSSLDKDLRKMRLDRYTPSAANEVRTWIEKVLGEKLAAGDLLEALKDGVALCKLINLAIGSPGVRYKTSAMPFVQMENISHFLRACQSPPLNLQPHDVFLTVDLYEQKDPAQVLQCINAFSRVAHQTAPTKFTTAIGPNLRSNLSPQGTGTPTVGGVSYGNNLRGVSVASSTTSGSSTFNPINRLTPHGTGNSNGGRWSPTKGSVPMSPGGVSSWSKKGDEGATSPAWNIAQYGYMGGASQGNMGISFGGRRQITSAGPHVPNAAEKEKKRREAELEKQRLEEEQKQSDEQRRREVAAEEERERLAEEERWAEESRKALEKQRRDAEAEQRKWEEEERRWRMEEERRQQEEREAAAKVEHETRRARGSSDARLRGQFLSQYQAEHGVSRENSHDSAQGKSRIQELEEELERAREREREYERERQERHHPREHRVVEDATTRGNRDRSKSRARSRSRTRPTAGSDPTETARRDEREYLRNAWASDQGAAPPLPSRPVQDTIQVKKNNTGPARPLPNPANYTSPKISNRPQYSTPTPERQAVPANYAAPIPSKQLRYSPPRPERPAEPPKVASPAQNRTERQPVSNSPRPKSTFGNTFEPAASETPRLASPAQSRTERHPASNTPRPRSTFGNFDSAAEDRRRIAAAAPGKAKAWASKSLLEREMELERQRQKEWEEALQAGWQPAARAGNGGGEGVGGQWDVNQWTGFTGGDSQNRGAQGIGAGRRQIVGPRPPPPPPPPSSSK